MTFRSCRPGGAAQGWTFRLRSIRPGYRFAHPGYRLSWMRSPDERSDIRDGVNRPR